MSDEVMNLDAFERMLKAFSPEGLREVTTAALKETGEILARSAQDRVNASPIAGKKAIRVKPDDYNGRVRVDIFNNRNPLARIYEGGTYKAAAQGGRMVLKRNGKDLKKPANRGVIKAYRFLEDAYGQHEGELLSNFERIFANLIERKYYE